MTDREQARCWDCRQLKPIDLFVTRWGKPIGLCRQCDNKRNAQYYAEHGDLVRGRNKKYNLTAAGYYSKLKHNAIKRNHELHISKEEYIEWFDNQPKICVYCGVELVRGGDRMDCLSIDRKDNNRDYYLDNIVLCCYSCNIIKNNMFTYEEMVEIGRRYIAPKKGIKPTGTNQIPELTVISDKEIDEQKESYTSESQSLWRSGKRRITKINEAMNLDSVYKRIAQAQRDHDQRTLEGKE